MASLDMPKREGYLKNPKRLDSDIKSVGKKGSTLGKIVTEGMPELLFGEEGTIPWYMSLAPGADLTDKIMEGRRPGLLDMPGVGTLGKFAMLPIAKFGSKEITKGTARMGKNARNLDKAKNPVIERWHRTRSKNDTGIKEKGILVGKDNPNYGKNTGDENQLKTPAAWLGTNPSEIPVLQYYFMNKPDEVSTYRVRIPKDEYYSTPRLKWDSGYRGRAFDARIVGKGESSLTGEIGRRTGRESMIDLFGKSIPPEYLEKISNKEIRKHADKNRNLENYIEELGEDPSNYTMSKLGTMLSSEDLNWMPFLDRTDSYTKLKEVGDRVSRNVARMPNYPPSEHLRDALNYYYTPDNRGNVPIPAYGYGMFDSQTRNLQFDASRPRGKFETHTIVPKSITEVKIPTDEQIQVGAISRGLETPYGFNPKDRLMDWDKYNNSIAAGETPFYAMLLSMPDKVLVDTPEGLQVRDIGSRSSGHISRGNSELPLREDSPVEALKAMKQEGVPQTLHALRLHNLMLERSNEGGFR